MRAMNEATRIISRPYLDGGRAYPRPAHHLVGFDTKERVLFPATVCYSHYHEDATVLVAEEAVSLDLPDVSSTFADLRCSGPNSPT